MSSYRDFYRNLHSSQESTDRIIARLFISIKKYEKLKTLFMKAIQYSYEAGHHDTVESVYCDPKEKAEDIFNEVFKQKIK